LSHALLNGVICNAGLRKSAVASDAYTKASQRVLETITE
jgi:hypothetical protein